MKAVFKTLLSMLLVAVVGVFIFSFSAFAAEGTVNFGLTDFIALQDREIHTTLYVDEGCDFINFEFQLKYDTDIVTLVSATENGDVDGSFLITPKENGLIHISFGKTSGNITKKTNFVDFVFLVDKNVGCGRYDFIELDYSRPFEANRMIDIPNEDPEFEPVEIAMNLDQMIIYSIGDVNADERVSILDVTILRQYLVEMRSLSEYKLILADAYSDGNVNIADAVRIQQSLAYEDFAIGDRINVTFHDADGEVYAVKSVKIGSSLYKIPPVPEAPDGYFNGRWSLDDGEYTECKFNSLTTNTDVYTYYDEDVSEAMHYYIDTLTQNYSTSFKDGVVLGSILKYGGSLSKYEAGITWRYYDSAGELQGMTKNDKGNYPLERPGYDTTLMLNAVIESNYDGRLESTFELDIPILLKGEYVTPEKAEIVNYLSKITGGEVSESSITGGSIDADLKFIRKITNYQVESDSPYEVRLEWYELTTEGVLVPITQVVRETKEKIANYVAVISFNGAPLEGDGKVYFDDVVLKPITQEEIIYYIQSEIANEMTNEFSEETELWNNDTKYKSKVNWISDNETVMSITNNIIDIKDSAVNGEVCPVTAAVTYSTGEGNAVFYLKYNVTVKADGNSTLTPDNLSDSLYYALIEELDVKSLTMETLKAKDMIKLDLSKYSVKFTDGAGNEHEPITSLNGIGYCENLKMLNISGLRITDSFDEIKKLTNLEVLLASDCDLNTLFVDSSCVLMNMDKLRVLDLSENQFSSMNEIFGDTPPSTIIEELYLNDNKITDISVLNDVTLIKVLSLAGNLLDNSDLAVLSKQARIEYLSLAGNNISDVSALASLTSLTELRLQENQISDISSLKRMTELIALYLGDNKIINIEPLKEMAKLEILYLNNNASLREVRTLVYFTELRVLNVNNDSISALSSIEELTKLEELYADNNKLIGFGFIEGLVNLKKLSLASNVIASDETDMINTYFKGLMNLTSLSLSGRKLQNLDFINSYDDTGNVVAAKPLERLELNGCELPAFTNIVTENGEVVSFTDNIAIIKSLYKTLLYLDISNNEFERDIEGLVFAENVSEPLEIASLNALQKLKILYADNVPIGKAVNTLMMTMAEIEYVSMENCDIDDISWISKSDRYVFIDVANNPIIAFSYSYVEASKSTIRYLYADTLAQGSFESVSISVMEGNVLEALSLKGYNIGSIGKLPDMDRIRFLDLSETRISDLLGATPSCDSLERYKVTLEQLYISQSNVNIFTKQNLDMLYSWFTNSEYPLSKVYLYANGQLPDGFSDDGELDADKEGIIVMGFIDNMPDNLVVAQDVINDVAQGVISDVGSVANPVLKRDVNGYTIIWNVDDENHYSASGEKLMVSSLDCIDDAELKLTASTSVYGTEIEKEFSVNTTILRADDDKYILLNATGAEDGRARGGEFVYHCVIAKAETDGFEAPVYPVYDVIDHKALKVKDSDENEVNDISETVIIVSEAEHKYKINTDAELGNVITCGVEIKHKDAAGVLVSDYSQTRDIKVIADEFTLSFETNGGTAYNKDNSVISLFNSPEEADITEKFYCIRTGYLFDGWYTDEALINEYTIDKMPSQSITLYAKWSPNTYTIVYNSNGGEGTMSDTICAYDKEVMLSANSFTKTGYSFIGWSTSTSVTYEDSAAVKNLTSTPDGIVNLSAIWQVNTYSIFIDNSRITVTYGEPIPEEAINPTKPNYAFKGYYSAQNGGVQYLGQNIPLGTEWLFANNAYAQWASLVGTWEATVENGRRDIEIVDENDKEYPEDIIPEGIDLAVLKSMGYSSVEISITYNVREIVNGYQEFTCFTTENVKFWSKRAEHGHDKKVTSWGTYTFKKTVPIEQFTQSNGAFWMRWGAYGKDEDTWMLGDTTIILRAMK